MADVTHSGSLAKRHEPDEVASCPLYQSLTGELKELAPKHSNLWRYLHVAPIGELGLPQYAERLTRSHKDAPSPNFIYNVGEGVFVHVYPDNNDSRDFYAAIEPGMGEDLIEVLDEVESRLVDLVHELGGAEGKGSERRELLLRNLDRICVVDTHSNGNDQNANTKLKRRGSKLLLSLDQMETLRYTIVRDKVGMGPIQAMIQDPNIEDISCSGIGPLFVEHKIFGSLKSNITFDSFQALDSFVMRLSEKIGKPVSFRDPIIDAALPDGSRINIVFGGDLSKRGSNFTIRKFSSVPMSIIELVQSGTLSFQAAAYLSLAIGEGMNVFCSGETASGKTTLLNALTTFIPPTAKIISIEDTPELQVPHPNWTREVVRGSTKTTGAAAVTMFDLLKAALRQRPNEILIGEIRGEEGLVAFQAMQTGHAGMATFHASSVEKLIQRLTGSPINVPKTYIDNLNVVAIQSAVRLPNGKTGRRVISISEIVGYDSASDAFSFIEVFRWDPTRDKLEMTGANNSYLLEQRIAVKRGLPPHRRREIYTELERRAGILKRLQEQKVTDFYAVYNVLGKAYRKGLFR